MTSQRARKEISSSDILAIDDDQATVEGLISEWELKGYTVETVASTRGARSKLRTKPYRLLLVDMRMPGPNGDFKNDAGLDLMVKLRRGELGPLNQNTPYVIYSAQQFRIETLERKLKPTDISQSRQGRLGTLSKGDDIRGLTEKVVSQLSGSARG